MGVPNRGTSSGDAGDRESSGFILKVLWRPVNRNSGLVSIKKDARLERPDDRGRSKRQPAQRGRNDDRRFKNIRRFGRSFGWRSRSRWCSRRGQRAGRGECSRRCKSWRRREGWRRRGSERRSFSWFRRRRCNHDDSNDRDCRRILFRYRTVLRWRIHRENNQRHRESDKQSQEHEVNDEKNMEEISIPHGWSIQQSSRRKKRAGLKTTARYLFYLTARM